MSLKSLDIFQRLSFEHLAKQTYIGALISVVAMSIMGFLLLREFNNYFNPELIKDTIIHQDLKQNKKLRVYLNILFPNCPCAIVSVDQNDLIRNHRMDISDTIEKVRINKDGSPVTGKLQGNWEALMQAITNKEGCKVNGYIDVNKVPGNIHISFHGYRMQWDLLRERERAAFESINLNHRILEIKFGTEKTTSKILNRFGFNEHTSFSRSENLPDYLFEQGNNNFEYFIKLIPYIFDDKAVTKKYYGYQYSVNFMKRDIMDIYNEMPVVTINYDLSPVAMKVSLDNHPISHVLTHICAIFGGVFVIFSILNRVFLNLTEKNEANSQ